MKWIQCKTCINDTHTHLHQVAETPLTEDILEEDHVLFVIGIWTQLWGQQGKRLMQPCMQTWDQWVSILYI